MSCEMYISYPSPKTGPNCASPKSEESQVERRGSLYWCEIEKRNASQSAIKTPVERHECEAYPPTTLPVLRRIMVTEGPPASHPAWKAWEEGPSRTLLKQSLGNTSFAPHAAMVLACGGY
ncbi:MAG: hypothetical protein SGPRY_009412, partial [Prymnesium sp.]